jgi:hypothetical protein
VARLLLYGGTLVAAALLLAADFVWRSAADAARAVPAELIVEAPVDPAEPNAFAALERAAEALAWPYEDEEWVRACIEEDACPAEEPARLLAANERALALLERVLATPGFRSPPMRTVESELPNMLRWVRLAKLLALRSAMEARAGELGALDSAVAAIRLGQRIEKDRSAVLIHAMIGLSLKRWGLAALRTAVRSLEPTADTSLRIARELEALRTDPESRRAMWSNEYRVMARSETSVELPESLRWLPEEYVYHPIASWNLYANRVAAFRRVAGLPCSELPPTPPELTSGLRRLLATLGPNGAGRLVVDDGVERLASYEHRRCASDTRIGAAQILVALQAHEVESGSFPARLEELVPRFLDAVPVEWFAGGPLDYQRATRRLSWPGVDETYQAEGIRRPLRVETAAF